MPNYQGVWSLSTQMQAKGDNNWPANYVTPIAVNMRTGGANTTNAYTTFNLSSQGNATNFGNADVNRSQFGRLSSTTRGVFAGDQASSGGTSIEYITIASAGNGTDFGNLTTHYYQFDGASNTTRGIFFVTNQSAISNAIEYITIASTGNSSDFGDSLAARRGNAATSSSTRALEALAYVSGTGQVNTVDYVTIANTGNATDFGDLSSLHAYKCGAFSSSTKAFFAAGGGGTGVGFQIIDQFTIASTGNATDWGDLLAGYNAPGATSSTVYGFIVGGYTNAGATGVVDTIQNVSLSSAGNSSDWGDLTEAGYNNRTVSSVHGGVA